ncbi:hypothetical protein E4K72_04150 [Oxalobacteraceae bacterium OM1]|nr:hypothetical protein E4K72_04150 [Oxalobacteraceae bacterium OM1]
MLIAQSAARFAGTLLAMVQTRMQLAAAEVEEESLRYFSYLLSALAALFCLGIAIVLAVILVVVLYWDTHRVGVLSTLMILFGLASGWIALRLRTRFAAKPPLLYHTLTELSRDGELLQPPA